MEKIPCDLNTIVIQNKPYFEFHSISFASSFLVFENTMKVVSLVCRLLSNFIGRRGGLMVSGLDSGSNGPGSSLGRGAALCS